MTYQATSLKYNTYFVEIDVEEIQLDFEDFSKNFKIDVEYDENEYGIYQNGLKLTSQFNISEKNKDYRNHMTSGYASIKYYKKDKDCIKSINKPQLPIPIGCYCELCKCYGNSGHKIDCKSERYTSNLYITLEGIVYSFDTIKEIVFSKTKENLEKKFNTKRKHSKLISNADELFNSSVYPVLYKFVEMVDVELSKTKFSNIKDAIRHIKSNINISKKDYEILFRAEDISILKYNTFFITDESYENEDNCGTFNGAIYISYVYPNKNKTNIRINSNKKITFVTAQYQKNTQPLFIKFLNDNKICAHNFMISTSSLSFNIMLNKKSLNVSEVKRRFENEKSIKCLNYEQNKNLFEYTYKNTKNGTVLIIKFTKHIKNNEKYSENTGESIIAQIYSTGNIQLTYTLSEDKKKNFKFTNYEYQFENIKNVCEQIKNIILFQINKIDKDVVTFEKETKKNLLFNTLSGLMPYMHVDKPKKGSVIQLFDSNLGKWSDNKSIILNTDYKTNTFTAVDVKNIIKVKIKNLNNMEYDYFKNINYNDNIFKIVKVDVSNAYLLDTREKQYLKYEDFKVIYKRYDDKNTLVKGKTSVSSTHLRPEPYSFYGLCPNSQTAVIDNIGNRGRLDNKYYPESKILSEKEYQEYKQNIKKYIYEGITDKESKLDTETNMLIDDFYCGTLKPESNELNSVVTFWDETSSTWKKGIIYKIENNKNEEGVYKNYTMQIDNIDIDEYPVITGDKFHPMYRESRNFKGIKSIPEDKLRQILYSCALNMNIIDEKIDLDTKSNYDDIVFEKIEYANIDNIHPVLSSKKCNCIVIPTNSVRSKLYINENNEYIVDEYKKLYKFECKMTKKNKNDNYVMDGFYNNKTKKYYAIDIILNNVEYYKRCEFLFKLKERIISNNFTFECSFFNNKKTLTDYISYHNNIENMMILANDNKKVCINNIIDNTPLIFQIIRLDNDKNEWILGMEGKEIEGVYTLRYNNIDLKNKYVKLKLNLNNNDGEIYIKEENKKKQLVSYYDIQILDSVDHTMSYIELSEKYNMLLKRVYMCMFKKWNIKLYDNNGDIIRLDAYKQDNENKHSIKYTRVK